MSPRTKKSEYKTSNNNGSISELMKELWQAAVNLRGSIEPADYKRYVLPIIFLRFLSMRYEKRRKELEKMVAEPQSDYFDNVTLRHPASLLSYAYGTCGSGYS